MKKPILIILLATALTHCNKENLVTDQPTPNFLNRISSVNYGYQEFFDYDAGRLKTYAVDIYGTGAKTFEMAYDHLKRPISIEKNGHKCASFIYNANTVSLYINDGLIDSLFYTLDSSGKIEHLEKYDAFSGSMLKNADKHYSYSGNNLIEIYCTEYKTNGEIKLNYTESAAFDTGINAFEAMKENPVLLEFLFQHIPSRIFIANSQNNITHLESNHPSDGYTLTQTINYNNLDQTSDMSYLKEQYGFVDQDTETYSYHK